MKSVSTKTDFVVDFGSVKDVLSDAELEKLSGFKLGEKVWFNASLIREKYSWGFIRVIKQQPNGFAVTVWDETRSMWRSFSTDKLFREKPKKERKPRRKV